MPAALPAVTVPPSRNTGPQRREPLGRRVGPRMLVALDERARTAAAGNLDRHDLAREPAVGLGRGVALLRAQRPGVLIGARDAVALGDVLAGLAHRLGAVALLAAAG